MGYETGRITVDANYCLPYGSMGYTPGPASHALTYAVFVRE